MTSSKVYLHRSISPDAQLGIVDADGKVYETRIGPDKYLGRVEVDSGKIYAARPGPDNYIGRIGLNSGKVHRAVIGPDEYLGRVEADGEMYYHQPMARDRYVGKITNMEHIAFGGGAFLLLVLPEVEARLAEEEDND